MKNLFQSVGILLPILFICLSLSSQKVRAGTSQSIHRPSKAAIIPSDSSRNKKAPDFTLKIIQGESFTLSDHEGKVVVLNFWATWCGTCRDELPEFIELQKAMRDQVVLFVGLAIDEAVWDAIRPYARQMDFNYPVVWDEGFDVTKKYGPLRGVPTTFMINRNGRMRYVSSGTISKNKLKPILKKMVKN